MTIADELRAIGESAPEGAWDGVPPSDATLSGLWADVLRLRELNASQADMIRTYFNDMANDRAEIERLTADRERMAAWLEGDVRCPCCDTLRTCVDGCTFGEDCPNEAERMAGARFALYGDAP